MCDADGKTLHDISLAVEVFPRREQQSSGVPTPNVAVLGSEDGPAQWLARELELAASGLNASGTDVARPNIVQASDTTLLAACERELLAWDEAGT